MLKLINKGIKIMGLMTVQSIVRAVSLSYEHFSAMKQSKSQSLVQNVSKGKVFRITRNENYADPSHLTTINFYGTEIKAWFHKNIFTGDKSFIIEIYIDGYLHAKKQCVFLKHTRSKKILEDVKESIVKSIDECPEIWKTNFFK